MRRIARAIALLALSLLCLSATPGWSDAGLSAEAAFSGNGIFDVSIAPDGDWLVAWARMGRRNGILAQRIGTGHVETLIVTEDALEGFDWVASDKLLARFQTRAGRVFVLFAFRREATGFYVDRVRFSSGGWLIAPLPDDDEAVLWAHTRDRRSTVYRMTFAQLTQWGETRDGHNRAYPSGERLLSVPGVTEGWVVDGAGRPRAYTRRDREGTTLLFRERGQKAFREVHFNPEDEEETALWPIGLTEDGERLIVAGYAGFETIGLHVLDPASSSVAETLIRRPDVDVAGALVEEGVVVGARFIVEGLPRHAYLDAFRSRFDAPIDLLESRYAPQSVALEAASADGRFLVFSTSGPTNPGDYHLHEIGAGLDRKIGVARPGLDRARLADVTSFVARSRDGTEIEAYLTLPRDASSPAPLVVYPHGGPIGVRDLRVYDPLVQYLASWGFAVLQPNYRGSGGYGRAFEEAGHAAWAKAIEDDIDAAVEHVIARDDVDGQRICIVGGSYGGFSALASVVRHRDRYRCAISVNGVSDVLLNFTARDFAYSKDLQEALLEIIGDPVEDREHLIGISPAYHVDRIETPVFLVYGTEDRRVDPDHSHRMALMLELHGKEWDSLEVEGMGHSPGPLEWVIVARAIRRELSHRLLPDLPFQADPDVGQEGLGAYAPQLEIGF